MRQLYRVAKFTATVFLLFCISFSYSQNLYWGQQYGGQATLKGGTSVVGGNDNSCIYYNPAAAFIVDSSNITASTYVAGIEYRKLKNGAGAGHNLSNLSLNILPQVLSVTIPVRKVPNLKIILGTLLRHNTNIGFSQQNEGYMDVVPGSPGTEYYKAQVQYSNNSLEQWAGISLAYRISRVYSVGLSIFGSYTHITTGVSEDLTLDAIANGMPYTASVNVNNSMSINQLNQVFKLGFTARYARIHIGAAVTLPGIKVFGIGSINKSFQAYNLNLNATDTTMPAQRNSSYVISGVQTGLKTRYTQPLSVSAGLELLYPKFKIAFAAEFFTGHKMQTVLQGTDNAFLRPTSIYNDTVKGFMSVQTSAVPVLNVGIGIEAIVRPTVNLLAGIRTDFNNRASYLPNNSTLNMEGLQAPQWHYLYFSGGVSYKLSLNNVIVGFDYGVGLPATHTQVFNITAPQSNMYLNGKLDNSMRTHVNKLNIILSWVYFFKPNDKKYGPVPFFDMVPVTPKEKKGKKAKKVIMFVPAVDSTKTDKK